MDIKKSSLVGADSLKLSCRWRPPRTGAGRAAAGAAGFALAAGTISAAAYTAKHAANHHGVHEWCVEALRDWRVQAGVGIGFIAAGMRGLRRPRVSVALPTANTLCQHVSQSAYRSVVKRILPAIAVAFVLEGGWFVVSAGLDVRNQLFAATAKPMPSTAAAATVAARTPSP